MEWKEVKLGDITSLVIDYRGKTPLKLGRDWSTSGYRALSAKNIKTGQIVAEESIRFVDDELYKLWMKEEVKRGDILITSEAPFGQVFYWNSDEKIVLSQRLFDVRIKESENSGFIYYYMSSPTFQKELDGRATGTTVVGLRQPELLKCKIKLPARKCQDKIYKILSSLDAKIENNNKINANLEAQAQALFKSWFVDFEPFQDGEFEDSELGRIPKGWKVGTLADLGEIVGGSTPSKAKPEYYTDNGIAWLTPKDLSISGAKFTSHGEIDITEAGYNSTSTKLMPRGSVLFSSRAPIGYITIAKNDICTNQGFKSVVPTVGGTCYIYCLLNYLTPEVERKSTGSTFKEASGSLMKSLPVIIPPKDILSNFENIIKPSFDSQEIIEDENKTLSHLRDTLLPKLMSGEIEV